MGFTVFLISLNALEKGMQTNSYFDKLSPCCNNWTHAGHMLYCKYEKVRKKYHHHFQLSQYPHMHYSVCIGDADTLLLLWILYSFFLFHSPTEIYTSHFSCMETSMISSKLWHNLLNGFNSRSNIFCARQLTALSVIKTWRPDVSPVQFLYWIFYIFSIYCVYHSFVISTDACVILCTVHMITWQLLMMYASYACYCFTDMTFICVGYCASWGGRRLLLSYSQLSPLPHPFLFRAFPLPQLKWPTNPVKGVCVRAVNFWWFFFMILGTMLWVTLLSEQLQGDVQVRKCGNLRHVFRTLYVVVPSVRVVNEKQWEC